MRRLLTVSILISGIVFIYSCKNSTNTNIPETHSVQNKVLQQDDGTISLKVDKADCYHDKKDPSGNTAEWNVVVSKSGRFDIWLSSATKDTTNLDYKNAVLLNILDKRIEAHPACDKVVRNSTDVSFPFFRADSFIGSLYIPDTGLYNVQIISEKILPKETRKEESEENSKLLSVFLTPATQ